MHHHQTNTRSRQFPSENPSTISSAEDIAGQLVKELEQELYLAENKEVRENYLIEV